MGKKIKDNEYIKIIEKDLEIERRNFEILVQTTAPQQFNVVKTLFNTLNLIAAANISSFIYFYSKNFFGSIYILMLHIILITSFLFAFNGIRYAIKYMSLKGYQEFFHSTLPSNYKKHIQVLSEKNLDSIEKMLESMKKRTEIIREIKKNIESSLLALLIFFILSFVIMMGSELNKVVL